MKDLMLMLSDAMPEKMLVQMLKDHIEEYLKTPTQENKSMMVGFAHMLVMKQLTDKMGLDKIMTEMASMEKAKDFFTLNKQ